jgi:hypothetical protein
MRTRTKIILWTLPLWIIVLTWLYNFYFNSGLTMPWQLVGKPKPSENISLIMGSYAQKLYVYTDAGAIYSLDFRQIYNSPGNPPGVWAKEGVINFPLDPISTNDLPQFMSPPPPFAVKQIYEYSPQELEGGTLTKFALADDGNLLLWSYGAGVFQGLGILLIFTIEVLAYILALFIGLVIYLIKRNRKRLKTPR